MIKSVAALKNIFKIKDLRDKVIYTLVILAIYRAGAHVPLPFLDRENLSEFMQQQTATGGIFQVISLFSGRAFEQMSVFALGIMPYISVSIIIQIMSLVFPRIQKAQQEGPMGQRKINRWTRTGTVFLGLFQGLGLGIFLLNHPSDLTYLRGAMAGVFLFTTMVTLTAGCAFVMWLGERITDKGIGNGISLIIAVGIMAHYPSDVYSLFSLMNTGSIPWIWAPVLAILLVLSTIAIILIQDGTRRIPMQHARRQVGRRILAGGTNYLPLKINTAGVIPVIFASAILGFPSILASYLYSGQPGGGFLGTFFAQSSPYNLYSVFQSWFGLEQGGIFNLLKSVNPYIVLFSLMTGLFCFFYTAVVFNPDDVANNLKKSGAFIPGKRPGKPTSEYIDYVLTRVTVVGAVFLVAIAILPLVLEVSFRMPFVAASFVGGTGLIIVVGVMLDTLKQIESQLMMRHYDSFAMRKTSAARWR